MIFFKSWGGGGGGDILFSGLKKVFLGRGGVNLDRESWAHFKSFHELHIFLAVPFVLFNNNHLHKLRWQIASQSHA